MEIIVKFNRHFNYHIHHIHHHISTITFTTMSTMNYYIDTLLTELRTLIADLGKGGGSVSPSVYDTAQVLRLYPPEDRAPAFAWLLAQQQADGGWGSPETPYARDVPTLAAILALKTAHQDPHTKAVIDAGLTFLQQQAPKWAELPIDALPIATEMVLPYLIEEANAAGLTISPTPYERLYQLRKYKSRQIAKIPLRAGTPPTHSWEALGKDVHSLLPDHSGGIGHSPAATAAWLRQAEEHRELAAPCKTARQYLAKAVTATGLDIPGVVPSVWPITGFELVYAPYALLVTNLLQQPALQAVVGPLMDELWVVMKRGHGVSFGEYFTPDGDDTGLGLAVLQATARPVDPTVLLQFKNGDHFCTFHHEINPSVFANAHALYGLAYAGERCSTAEHFLLKQQGADGRWLADKLHTSWLYTTLEVVLTLSHLGYQREVRKAAEALSRHQKADGGWGSGQNATWVETSYAVITLSTLDQRGLLNEAARHALQRGYQWLSHTYRPHTLPTEKFWVGKELYTPYRVDRIYGLSALLAVTLERMPV